MSNLKIIFRKGANLNGVKLRAVSIKNVFIVANAAIHCEVTIGFKMVIGLRRYDENP